MTKPVDGRISLILREKREYLSTSIISAYFTRIRIAVQLREHAQIPTRPARLLAAIRANSLTLRQSARWQQLAQSSWRNQSWVLRISTATGCAENHYIGKMISQHYIVCDDDTWLSNYYHTIYMWLVHLCKDTWWRIWLYLCYIRMFHVKHWIAAARFLWWISCHTAAVNCIRYLYKQQ